MRPTAIAAFTLLIASGCVPPPRLLVAQPGPMPEGETFTGTYTLERDNTLAIIEERGNVTGVLELESAPQRIGGRLQIKGKATGDLVRFTWHRDSYPIEDQPRGHGYFRIHRSDSRAYVAGEIGIDENELGTSFRMEKVSSSRPNFSWETVCDELNQYENPECFPTTDGATSE